MSDIFASDHLAQDGKATDAAKEKRYKELEHWFLMFAKYFQETFGTPIQYQNDIVRVINHNYWELLEENVRPLVKSRDQNGNVVIDRHKIASLTELLIVHLQPIVYEDNDTRKLLNARQAFFIASNIIGNWDQDKVSDLFVSESFNSEHLAWLRYLSDGARPFAIFSNSATWYLVEKIFLDRTR